MHILCLKMILCLRENIDFQTDNETTPQII